MNYIIRKIEPKDNLKIAAVIRNVFEELDAPKVGTAYADPHLNTLFEVYQKDHEIYFVVEKDGSITDIKVLKDLGHGTGEEAIRILKKCPKWSPAEQKGKKVRCSFMLPLRIQSP